MLRELRIRNFAVIESVAVEFRPGLNVLTGETGAGKSMLIDAILLVLGARAQTDVIRSDADAATVEAVFDVEPRGAVAATLDEADRKSTRLNSSHTVISYAVFCLKKKKTDTPTITRQAVDQQHP